MAYDPSAHRELASGKQDLQAPTLTTTAATAPAGGTGATAGAYDSAVNRNIAILTIQTNKTRIDEIEARLKALGILI
jgi:hypothetical protein